MAWLATASARYHLLLCRNLHNPAELACFYCPVLAGRACSFTTLTRVAGRRWPTEEDFALGKSWFGLADSQARRRTAITRHLALAMAALAVCAVTAALVSGRHPNHDGDRRLARSGYSFHMAEEWRVSVIFAGHGARKYHHPIQVCALLRSGLGEDITVSAGKLHIFMYAGTADAAEEAEHVARQALAQLGLSEDCRLERWDTSSQEWLEVRSGLPTAEEADLGTTRLRAAAGKFATNLAGAVVEGFIQGN